MSMKKSKKILRHLRNPNHHDPEITFRNKQAQRLKVCNVRLKIVSDRLKADKDDHEAYNGFRRVRAELAALGVEV